MKTIGTAKIKDFDSLMDWAENLTLQESIEFADKVMGLVDEMYPEFRHSNRSDTPTSLRMPLIECIVPFFGKVTIMTTNSTSVSGPRPIKRAWIHSVSSLFSMRSMANR